MVARILRRQPGFSVCMPLVITFLLTKREGRFVPLGERTHSIVNNERNASYVVAACHFARSLSWLEEPNT